MSETTTTNTVEADSPTPIVARAGRYYRNTRYVIVLVLVLYGIWSIRDGYFVYPQQNQKAIDELRTKAVQNGQDPDKVVDPATAQVPHPGWDIPFNRAIGIALPPLALFYLWWTLHNSRGEYRLEGTTLHVPGHPPVPFDNITEIDKRLWDKKGIAYISYDMGGGKSGTLRLDDFVYEAAPTDEIFKRVEAFVNPAQAPATEQADKSAESTSA